MRFTRSGALRRIAHPALCLLLVLAPAVAPVPAHAQPAVVEPGPGGELVMSWRSLGLPASITLVGANATQGFTLPIPAGFTGRRLRGIVRTPVDFGSGFVEITDSTGRFLGSMDLPDVTPGQAAVPFDVDITAAATNGASLGLSFTVRENARTDRCGLGESLEVRDLETVFTGADPPSATIAAFFPPVLQRLTIYTPVDADDAEKQAVLTLTSAVARMYRPQSPAITVVPQARGATPPPAPGLARAVVVENGDAGITVVNADRPDAYLKLAGRGDQLTDQTSLVANRLQSLAQVPTARVDAPGSSGTVAADRVTFGDLGLKGETSVLRTSDFVVGVDRSALGPDRVDNVQVHLLANHTPVSPADAASVMVRVNGQSVYAAPLNDSGRIDAVFEVPDELLSQRINFEFDLTFSPRQLCSPTLAPLTFQLDPGSTLAMRRGGQPAGGFGAVPSELSPEFLVAFDGSSPNQLGYAAQVVADIARLTGTTLTPRIVDIKSAADAGHGALIVANAATIELTSLRPPIGGKSSEVQIDLRNQLRADIDNGLGSIQVFADTPRNRSVVLVTTSGAWSLVEPLFGYIDQLPDGWSSLTGDVLAAGAAGTVTDLSVGSADAATSGRQPPAADLPLWLTVVAGCLVVAVFVLVGVRLRRRD